MVAYGPVHATQNKSVIPRTPEQQAQSVGQSLSSQPTMTQKPSIAPRSLTPGDVLHLQRMYGNRWVLRHFTSAAAPTTTSLIQRAELGTQVPWLSEQTDAPFPKLSETVKIYDTVTTNQDKQALLHQIEHTIYTWLTAPLEEKDKPLAIQMLDFMDAVQAHHREIVKAVMSSEDETVFALDDKNTYSKEASRAATILLARISAGAGSIVIDETDFGQKILSGKTKTVPGFKDEVLAAFARLLTTEEERNTVSFMLDRKKVVTIIPMTSATKSGFEMMQNWTKKDQKPEPLDTPGVVLPAPEKLAPTEIQNSVDFARLMSIANTGEEVPFQTEDDTESGVPMGAGAYLALEPGLKDSEVFGFDESGKPIPTPEFVTLGHELRHALNIQLGVSGRAEKDKTNEYPNMEERNTIEGTENSVRGKHNLGRRSGHGGLRRGQLEKLFGKQ